MCVHERKVRSADALSVVCSARRGRPLGMCLVRLLLPCGRVRCILLLLGRCNFFIRNCERGWKERGALFRGSLLRNEKVESALGGIVEVEKKQTLSIHLILALNSVNPK